MELADPRIHLTGKVGGECFGLTCCRISGCRAQLVRPDVQRASGVLQKHTSADKRQTDTPLFGVAMAVLPVDLTPKNGSRLRVPHPSPRNGRATVVSLRMGRRLGDRLAAGPNPSPTHPGDRHDQVAGVSTRRDEWGTGALNRAGRSDRMFTLESGRLEMSVQSTRSKE